MSNVTYKNLYTLVQEQIDKSTLYQDSESYRGQLTRTSVQPMSMSSSAMGDVSIAELVRAIQTSLDQSIPPWIIEGLTVSATDPITANVVVSAGSGTVGGKLFTLAETMTIAVPLSRFNSIHYITLDVNGLEVTNTYSSSKLTLAKIVVPNPGTSEYITNIKDGSWNAYIVNFKEYKLYGDANGFFEEDTIELLRDNISPILADNLIGNIRLSEDLKITNTQGTLELNSDSLKLYDVDENVLAKFNRNGVYFYNPSGVELARFTSNDAKIGNILITTSTLESLNFVSGALGSGFRIQDDGYAEFNNVYVRGKFTTTVFEKDTISVIGGSLLVMDGDILDADMTSSDSSNMTISGDTTFAVNDILRIKDGVDDEWFTVASATNAPTYSVTRDRAGSYAANANPAWKKGTSVVNFGASGEGGIYLSSSEINSPYMSIVTHAGSPWSSLTTHLRVGNLNGFLGYSSALYGIGIGTAASYLTYDPTNGLQIKGSITITGGDIPPKSFYQDAEPTNPGDDIHEGDYWVDTNDSNKLYIYQGSAWVVVSASGTGGITSFAQAAVPTSLAAGDLWLDTDDGNKLYRAEAIGANEIKAGEWVAVQDANKSTTFAQASIPTSLAVGDYWVDTDDGNRTYRAASIGADQITAGEWVEISDANKTTTFAQASIPVSKAIGDLWVDTDDKNKLYRAESIGADAITAGEWVIVRDTDISQALSDAATAISNASAAQSTANARITTFYQAGIPTALAVGDLWIDTDDSNKLYRATAAGADEIKVGEWVEVRDAGIATAIANAATAQTTADGKIVTFSQPSVPTATDVGDFWIDTDDYNRIYRASSIGANEIKAGEWVEITPPTIVSFYQAAIPTSLHMGDIWIDTNADNKIYRAYAAGATTIAYRQWEEVTPTSGIKTFKQNDEPPTSSQTVKTGDLWMDTNDGNRLWRYGAAAWEMVRDAGSQRALDSLDSDGTLITKVLPGCNVGTPIGEGLYLGADYMGYYSGSCWQSYIDNTGQFTFKGDANNYVSWDGSALSIRGLLCATDICAGTLNLSIGGVCIQNVEDASNNHARTSFDAYGIRSYDDTGAKQLDIRNGQIWARDAKFEDPACACNFSCLTAGQLHFHDKLGEVPYVTRICSGIANTGTSVCLNGWCTSPQVTVGVKTLMSYDASCSAQDQAWNVYSDTPVWYCTSATCYGYCFGVHAQLQLAVGTGAEVVKDVCFGTSACTAACTCSTCVKSVFQLWCNTLNSNLCYGTMCYDICYRVVGAGGYCECTFCYVQPHGSVAEIKSCSTDSRAMAFPCMATWEILDCQVSLTYTDSGFPAYNCVWCCLLCCCNGTYWTYGFTCTVYGSACTMNILYACCQTAPGNCQAVCTASVSFTGFPSNVYSSVVYWCYSAAPTIQGHNFATPSVWWVYNGGYCCIRFCDGSQSVLIDIVPASCDCVCSGGVGRYCKTSSTCQTTWSMTACVRSGCWCCHTCICAPAYCICQVLTYCCLCNCQYTVDCSYWYYTDGAPASCDVKKLYSLTDTYGCYTVLDPSGTLNWIAISYN